MSFITFVSPSRLVSCQSIGRRNRRVFSGLAVSGSGADGPASIRSLNLRMSSPLPNAGASTPLPGGSASGIGRRGTSPVFPRVRTPCRTKGTDISGLLPSASLPPLFPADRSIIPWKDNRFGLPGFLVRRPWLECRAQVDPGVHKELLCYDFLQASASRSHGTARSGL